LSQDVCKRFSNVGIVATGSTRPEIQIFPNPTTGQLRVTSYELQMESVEIYDVVGRKLSHFTIHNSHFTIDISHLANGMYFLKVGGKVFKVVKQ